MRSLNPMLCTLSSALHTHTQIALALTNALAPPSICLHHTCIAIHALHPAVVHGAHRVEAILVAHVHCRGAQRSAPHDACVLKVGLVAIDALRPRVVRRRHAYVTSNTGGGNVVAASGRAVFLASL